MCNEISLKACVKNDLCIDRDNGKLVEADFAFWCRIGIDFRVWKFNTSSSESSTLHYASRVRESHKQVMSEK